jgi:hypothetical protein
MPMMWVRLRTEDDANRFCKFAHFGLLNNGTPLLASLSPSFKRTVDICVDGQTVDLNTIRSYNYVEDANYFESDKITSGDAEWQLNDDIRSLLTLDPEVEARMH